MTNKLSNVSVAIILFCAFISPFLSLYAGLSLIVVFMLLALLPVAIMINDRNFSPIFRDAYSKITIITAVYALISSLWAVDPEQSINLLWRMLLIFIAAIASLEFAQKISNKQADLIGKYLLSGLIIAFIGANIEYFFDGIITKFFRGFQEKEHVYALTDLNRGASYLSLMIWPVFAYLFLNKRKVIAIVLLLIAGWTLTNLESQSSVMGLILGVLAFIFIYFTKKTGMKILMALSVISVILVAYTAKTMDPAKIYQEIPEISGSASEYRLHIWSFAANKASEKPLLGWGFNSARSIPVTKEEYLPGGRHPLPLHTHNNVMQIWLELGAVGLVLFSAFMLSIMYTISQNNSKTMAFQAGLFATYFAIGETGYGIWQNWWVAAGIISAFFIFIATKNARNSY